MNLPLPRPTFPPKIESFCFLLGSAFPSHHRVSHILFGLFGGMCRCFTAKQLHLVTADSRKVRLIRGMKALRGHAARGARAHLVAETPPHDFTAFSTGACTASRLLPWGLVLFHGSAGPRTLLRLLPWGYVLFHGSVGPMFSRTPHWFMVFPRTLSRHFLVDSRALSRLVCGRP